MKEKNHNKAADKSAKIHVRTAEPALLIEESNREYKRNTKIPISQPAMKSAENAEKSMTCCEVLDKLELSSAALEASKFEWQRSPARIRAIRNETRMKIQTSSVSAPPDEEDMIVRTEAETARGTANNRKFHK